MTHQNAVETFRAMVARTKLHSIGGVASPDDLLGLMRRANTLGIGPVEAQAIIKETPSARRAPRWLSS